MKRFNLLVQGGALLAIAGAGYAACYALRPAIWAEVRLWSIATRAGAAAMEVLQAAGDAGVEDQRSIR